MIRLVHHHLRRGGVTRVMVKTAEILRDAGHEVEILSGETSPESLPEGVGFQCIPGMGYHDPDTPTDADALTQTLSGVSKEGDIWHIHNHSLGKNPAVSDAWVRLAEQGERVVFQPHDFAEDGRPANLDVLRKQFPGFPDRLYPIGANIQYAVLQERDRGVLDSAGIPAEHIHLLPNPVAKEFFAEPQRPAKRILYLTRGIRRKNIGEFLYWAKHLGDDFEVATSLLPENPTEKKIFDAWELFAEQQNIPVTWGIGAEGRSFKEVVEWGDVCMTTSVGEGFGMSFLEPYAMGRSVVGRDLPDITAGFKQDGVNLGHLYSTLPVLADALDPEFWPRAESTIHTWQTTMGCTKRVTEKDLKNAWIVDDHIDFGRLDEQAQQAVLTSGATSTTKLSFSDTEQHLTNATQIESAYASEPYLKRLEDLYSSIEVGGEVAQASGNKLRDAFLDLKSVYLLRT